jgi:hypothetical protein
MSKLPTYKSGENILIEDRVKYDNEDGIIEDIITEDNPNWENYWKKLGTGVMVKCPKYGRVFVKFEDEDLLFISRKNKNSNNSIQRT